MDAFIYTYNEHIQIEREQYNIYFWTRLLNIYYTMNNEQEDDIYINISNSKLLIVDNSNAYTNMLRMVDRSRGR